MGNVLTQGADRIVIGEESLLKDYKNATVDDYRVAKSNFDALQETVGDKMTVTIEEFDEIFSLICQDPAEHFRLFDCWELDKVDVMEVLAVIIVYCKCPFDVKIPLLFDLFDFDHSKAISQSELVLLMLCATRGLCKVVGLERPDTETLENLAKAAFTSIDRNHDGQISLAEFSDWAAHEPSLVEYLTRFASTRLIFDNQQHYDAMMKALCDSFVQFSASVTDGRGRTHLGCTIGTCREVIRRHIPHTTSEEIEYLIRAMQHAMERAAGAPATMGNLPLTRSSSSLALLPGVSPSSPPPAAAALLLPPEVLSMEVFCIVLSPYVAFVAADEDRQRVVDARELRVLLWLLRGKEPAPYLVTSFMKSLDRDQNGVLSPMEWVTFALENDARTGSLAFTAQVQLLFVGADRNADGVLSIQELIDGLKPILLEGLVRALEASGGKLQLDPWTAEIRIRPEAEDPSDSALHLATRRRQSQSDTVHGLITGLANEVMQVMDTNDSHRIEWFEFRQHLDFLQRRLMETHAYILEHVLA